MCSSDLSFYFLSIFLQKNRGIPPHLYSPKGFSRYIVPHLFIFRPPTLLIMLYTTYPSKKHCTQSNCTQPNYMQKIILYTTHIQSTQLYTTFIHNLYNHITPNSHNTQRMPIYTHIAYYSVIGIMVIWL